MSEEKAPKPITTYSKEYVLERIEARQGALKIKISTISADLDKFAASQNSEIKVVFEKNRQRAYEISERADKALIEFTDAEGDVQKQRQIAYKFQTEFGTGIESLPRMPSPTHWRNRQGDYSSLSDNDRIAVEQGDIVDFQSELYALDHTIAYLRDVPVTEFTLTGLQKLGLLDAIKFSLVPQPAN